MKLLDDVETRPCTRHPRRQTALRCGKCETPICTRCIVQTPVGARCRDCAQLRRLPQFDVGWSLLARSSAAALGISLLGWYLLSFVAFLRFFLAIVVGAAVGEAMSRLAKRRTNLTLEVAAVLVIVLGLAIVDTLRFDDLWSSSGAGQAVILSDAIPVIVASFIAVIKLR